MIKVLLFDFSRVLLHPKDTSYTGKLNDLNRAMGGEYPLGPYPFWQYFFLNQELLDFLAHVKKEKSICVTMFTTDIIQERSEIKEKISGIFDHIFTARALQQEGLKAETMEGIKATKEAFLTIAKKLSVSTHEIFFVDDTIKNITAAKSAGCATFHFPSDKPLAVANEDVAQKIMQSLNE